MSSTTQVRRAWTARSRRPRDAAASPSLAPRAKVCVCKLALWRGTLQGRDLNHLDENHGDTDNAEIRADGGVLEILARPETFDDDAEKVLA